uniref:F-box domain-containing protein n=1 Tax=Oryza nivara TaxID=4536 RepID=A0A0E0J4M6_ORYNI
MDVLLLPPLPAPETTAAAGRDWSELPADALSVVFAKVGAVEVLAGAGLACRSWLDAARVPELWRAVDMLRGAVRCLHLGQDRDLMCAMAKVAVDRSGGRLEVFKGEDFVTDELLEYIGDRSPSLKVISVWCSDETRMSTEGFAELTRKCPLLEEIVLSGGGHRRPPLPRLALAVAELRHLRRLTLQGIGVSNDELTAIVDGCPRLELLDVCSCWDLCVDDDAQLLAKCARIRTLKLPPSEEDDYYDYYCLL